MTDDLDALIAEILPDFPGTRRMKDERARVRALIESREREALSSPSVVMLALLAEQRGAAKALEGLAEWIDWCAYKEQYQEVVNEIRDEALRRAKGDGK